jgi:YidC/Oxa1 family membrane protein insertase
MPLWNQIVEVLREAIFAYAQACHGNIGFGIVVVTFLARLALFPLMVRIARASAAHQAALLRIQPELDALKARMKDAPQDLFKETQRVFARERMSMLPIGGFLGTLAPMPILIALYSSVRQAAALGGRFLWVENIAAPNLILTIAVAGLGAAAAATGTAPGATQRIPAMMIVLPAVITIAALWSMASGVAIYWGVSSLAGLAQTLVINRRTQRMP